MPSTAQLAALAVKREHAVETIRRLARTDVPEGCPLTNREWQIVTLYAGGMIGKQIAAELEIAPATVASALHTARRRLRATTTLQLVIDCYRAGWFDLGPGTPYDQAKAA